MSEAKFKRILLKLSGEALAGNGTSGINNETLVEVGQAVGDLHRLGVEVAVVVGGGNWWRGRSSEGMDRVTADHMGMLATTMNALALSDALEQAGVTTRVMSAIEMRQIAETYIRKRALRHLEKGRVVLLERVIPISPRIQRLPCEQQKSVPMSSSKQRTSMVSMIRTRMFTRTPCAMKPSRMKRSCNSTSV